MQTLSDILDEIEQARQIAIEQGVTTENGKNSTLSDLVFVKVIDN